MSEFALPRNGARSSRRGQRSGNRIRGKAVERVIGGFIVVAASAALASSFFLLVPSALRVSNYEISGVAAMTRDEVLSAALIHEREYFFAIEPARIRSNLLADPRVADAIVRRRFPNGLTIAVRERVPVAAVLAEVGGRPTAISLDAHGVAFALADAASLGQLPVLSGLRFENFRLGSRLPDSIVPVLLALGEIESSEPALLAAFSEIRIVKPRYGEAELLLYPVHHRIPVRAGAVLNAQTLRSIILVLDILGSRLPPGDVEEVDFRTGTVVYRTKEGQPG